MDSVFQSVVRRMTNCVWQHNGNEAAAEFEALANDLCDEVLAPVPNELVTEVLPLLVGEWQVEIIRGGMSLTLPEGGLPPNVWWRFWQWAFLGFRWSKC